MPEVRCIGPDGEQIGVIPTREALERSRVAGLDLVEVSATARPPVARIMDYGRYKFEQSKKSKQMKKNASATKMKEIKFHANVDDHDYETKLRHIRDFLSEGHRVKVSLGFRGRENAHQEIGYQLVKRVIEDISDIGNNESEPQKMGRFLNVLLNPKSGQVKG